MPLEAELPSEPRTGAERPVGAKGSGVSHPLGRGLEDISHLFLSRPAPAPAGERASVAVAEPATAPPATRIGVAVLRPGARITREPLVATLQECRSALTSTLKEISAGISCDPYGDIDLIALDADDRLAIIDVETAAGDNLLPRGLAHVDWVVRHPSIVQRLCPTWSINATLVPRLLLVAPRFSPAMMGAVRQIAAPDIACFRYHDVDLSGRPGIFVEYVDTEGE